MGGKTRRPVALRHLTGVGLIPELGEDRDGRTDLAEVVAEDGCSSGVSLFANLFEEADATQLGITLQPFEDIRLVGVQLAGFDAGTGRRGRTITSEVVPHGLAIEAGLSGECTDVNPAGCLFLFTSEIFEHEIILLVEHSSSTGYSMIPEWGILFRRKWGVLHRRKWGVLFRR